MEAPIVLPHICKNSSGTWPRMYRCFQIDALNDRRWVNERRREYLEQLKTGRYEQNGVYLMFNQEEKLEYVGVATTTFHESDLVSRFVSGTAVH